MRSPLKCWSLLLKIIINFPNHAVDAETNKNWSWFRRVASQDIAYFQLERRTQATRYINRSYLFHYNSARGEIYLSTHRFRVCATHQVPERKWEFLLEAEINFSDLFTERAHLSTYQREQGGATMHCLPLSFRPLNAHKNIAIFIKKAQSKGRALSLLKAAW